MRERTIKVVAGGAAALALLVLAIRIFLEKSSGYAPVWLRILAAVSILVALVGIGLFSR